MTTQDARMNGLATHNQSASKTGTGQRSDDGITTVRIERDMQGVTVDGFNTLGIASTFLAGVEAQCFSLISDPGDHNPHVIEAISALFLFGIFLSTFGAVTAFFAGRWFNLLRGAEVELLDHRWSCARPYPATKRPAAGTEAQDLEAQFDLTPEGHLPSLGIRNTIEESTLHTRNMILAKALFLPFHLIVVGFFSFITGLLVYTWEFRPLGTSIICTIITIIGVGVIGGQHVNFNTMGALNKMSFRRPKL